MRLIKRAFWLFAFVIVTFFWMVAFQYGFTLQGIAAGAKAELTTVLGLTTTSDKK